VPHRRVPRCAEAHHAALTRVAGFKYIGNTALDLVRDGLSVPFGYEEAIGFMFGDEIRDKDGVAATVSLPNAGAAA
jgi:phosphomannomutase